MSSSTAHAEPVRDVAAGPIAAVHLPRRMPFGFHANWFAAADT